jgi:predicted kinase
MSANEEDLSCFLTQQTSQMARKSASTIEARREAREKANRLTPSRYQLSEKDKALVLDVAVNLAQFIIFK